jgi:MFS family permease
MSQPSMSPQSRTLRMLWQATFWVAFPFGILSFVLPIYGKELGATALEVGGFFSATSLVPVVVRPFLGRALDRWGRRPFLLLGLLGYVVAMVMFCLADTVFLLTAARFVQGLGQAFLWLSAYTIVADVADETGRGHNFGTIDEAVNLYTFAYFLGAALGPLAGGWLYDNLGHAQPFYLNTVGLLVGALLVAAVLREPTH